VLTAASSSSKSSSRSAWEIFAGPLAGVEVEVEAAATVSIVPEDKGTGELEEVAIARAVEGRGAAAAAVVVVVFAIESKSMMSSMSEIVRYAACAPWSARPWLTAVTVPAPCTDPAPDTGSPILLPAGIAVAVAVAVAIARVSLAPAAGAELDVWLRVVRSVYILSCEIGY
jgi:hypothetical protein